MGLMSSVLDKSVRAPMSDSDQATTIDSMIRIAGPALRRILAFGLPIAVALVIVACGGTSDTSEGDADAPTTVDPPRTETTLAVDPPSTTTEEASDDTAAVADSVEPVVYADDYATSVQPIFAEVCASCHSSGGPGTAHWELTTAGELVESHGSISEVVASGFMPPWPAGGESPPFREDRSLRPDQVQAILDWSAAGAPLDVPADTAIEPINGVVGLHDPDVIVTPSQPYAGTTAVVDDYRCQIYDPQLADGGWITGYEFIPDQTEVVHHAVGYLVPASAREQAAARDGQDGKPGWQCYGGSGLNNENLILGWAPGQLPSVMPDGAGLRVEPGDFLVIQIHYHYETDAPADLSEFALTISDGPDMDAIVVTDYAAPAEIPCSSSESGPLCERDAALAEAFRRYGPDGVLADLLLRFCGYTVDDFADMNIGTASSSCDWPAGAIGGAGEIIAVLGHEHEIGAWFKMTLNPDTPDEQVLLDIPDWDFDWQYNYVPVERIVIDRDDVIRIECGWDRSRRSPDLEPAYVLWADGTNDEMCFATIATIPT